jgi:cobalt-zinc-cadmium efflux system outer membrane protein
VLSFRVDQNHRIVMRRLMIGLSMAAGAALVGCSSVPADRGWSQVSQTVAQRQRTWSVPTRPLTTLDPYATTLPVQTLLAEPLTAERAVALALLNQPALQQSYARLGLAQADVLAASRLSNPTLSLGQLSGTGEGRRLDYSIAQSFTDLLFLSTRKQAATLAMQRTQTQVSDELQQLGLAVIHAHQQAVLTEQMAQMQALISKTVMVSARLSTQFYAAGNINALEHSRQQAAASQAQLALDQAHADAEQARLALARLMGLSAQVVWRLDSRWAQPIDSDAEDDLALLQTQAQQQRLDLQATNQAVQQSVQTLALAKRLSWLPLLDIGLQGERDRTGARLIGPTVTIALPIFGINTSSHQHTQAWVEQTQADHHALALDIDQQVALAYQHMNNANRQATRYVNGLIPQREAVLARLIEQQNYMLVGPFEVLAAKQQVFETQRDYLRTVAAYWLARTALIQAVGAPLSTDRLIGTLAIAAPVLPAVSKTNSHAGHHMPAPTVSPSSIPHADHGGH